MLALRQLVEPTAVSASCVLRLVSNAAAPAPYGSSAVLLAAVAESVHVFDLVPGEPSSQLRPRGHVFEVGCGVSALLALASQCFLIWTRDFECIIVRYQANLAPAPQPSAPRDGVRVCREDGVPTPVHDREQHWYVVRRMRLWCPDVSELLAVPQLGVNSSKELAYVRFSVRHVFFIGLTWAPGCAAQARVPAVVSALLTAAERAAAAASKEALRTCRWHSGNYLRAYAGTGFRYPTQGCSVATQRPHEDGVVRLARLERLWLSRSPYANVPDEDLIAKYAVGDLSRHKTAEAQSAEAASYAAVSPSATVADYCGIIDVTVRREAHTATSPLTPTCQLFCGHAQGGFAALRGSGDGVAVHHTPMTLTAAKSAPLKDAYAARHTTSMVVVAPRRVRRRELEWAQLVLASGDAYTAVYHLQKRRTPLAAPHLALDFVITSTAQPQCVLVCARTGDALSDVWVALDTGVVTCLCVPTLRAQWSAGGEAACGEWPTVAIAGLPTGFLCRHIVPADELVPGASTGTCTGGGGGIDVSEAAVAADAAAAAAGVYPLARRFALLADGVQHAFVVDLVDRRVVASLVGDGPMTDISEAPHGYVASFASGVLRQLQPGLPLHVCGTAGVGGVIETLSAARLASGSAAVVYLMLSTRSTSQLLAVEEDRVCAATAGDWHHVKDEPTLAFGTDGVAGLAQCTATRWCVGAAVHDLPFVLSHAGVADMPGVGLVCAGAAAPSSEGGPLLLALGTAQGVSALSISEVLAGPLTCVTAVAEAASVVPDADAAGATEAGSLLVALGRWDGGVSLVRVRRVNSAQHWSCVAAGSAEQSGLGVAAPVQRLVPLPAVDSHPRWLATHTCGAVSLLAIVPPQVSGAGAAALRYAWARAGDPTTPLSATVAVPLLRAGGGGGGDAKRGAFDAALLQPRDGGVVLVAAALMEEDEQTPPGMRRHRDAAELDVAWRTRLECAVRALLDTADAAEVTATAWREAVVLERVASTGSVTYDVLVAHRDRLTLLAVDRHVAAAAPPACGRAYCVSAAAPTRYVCTRRLVLRGPAGVHTHETLFTVATAPDGTDGPVTLCASAAEAAFTARLALVRSASLAVLETLSLEGYALHWMAAVPPTAGASAASPLFVLCMVSEQSGEVELALLAAHPLRLVTSVSVDAVQPPPDVDDVPTYIDGTLHVVLPGESAGGIVGGGGRGEVGAERTEVLVALSVGCGVHLFVLRGYSVYFQHCVVAPSVVSSVEFCYPVLSVCTRGSTHVYLQVYPTHDTTEALAPAYTPAATVPLQACGKVSWKMRVEAREPTCGTEVLAQTCLYDRFVRTDLEGGVAVVFAAFAPVNAPAKSRGGGATLVNREDAYVGSAEGPQVFLTHAVRLASVPTHARLLRRVNAVWRRFPRQLQCFGRHIALQPLSTRQDGTSRLLLLPCQDGSLYSAFELPYAVAHPLLRLEEVIANTYALDLTAAVQPGVLGRLRHTYHMRPFHHMHALQPVVGSPQAQKQACVMVDAVNEYFMLRDVVRHGWSRGATTTKESVADEAAAHRRFAALDDLVQTLLTEEYSGAYTVDDCAEVVNAS